MDLHVHTSYSDGSGTPAAMIDRAIALGIKDFGITDHYGGIDGYAIVTLAGLDEYIAELTRLKHLHRAEINIWIGLETVFLDDLPFPRLNKLDYVLFEDIETGPRLDYFVRRVKPYLRIPGGVAHPHVLLLEKSAGIVEREGLFIELNTHYPDRYRGNWAWTVWEKLLARDIHVSVASDAHNIRRVGDTRDALRFIEDNNLWEKVWLPKRHGSD